jgi:uncharacterized membrane protein YhaH (DUF805 family)
MARHEFLQFMLLNFVFLQLASLIGALMSLIYLPILYLIVFLVPTISAMVRRLHDTGNRARWLLTLTILAVFVIFSTFVTLSSCFLDVKNNTYLDVMLLLFFPSLFTIGALIYKLCQKGKRGVNKYGPDPVEVKTDEGEG